MRKKELEAGKVGFKRKYFTVFKIIIILIGGILKSYLLNVWPGWDQIYCIMNTKIILFGSIKLLNFSYFLYICYFINFFMLVVVAY